MNKLSEDERNCKDYIEKHKSQYNKNQLKNSLLKTKISEDKLDKYLDKYYVDKKLDNSEIDSTESPRKVNKVRSVIIMIILLSISLLVYYLGGYILKVFGLFILYSYNSYLGLVSSSDAEKLESSLFSPFKNFMSSKKSILYFLIFLVGVWKFFNFVLMIIPIYFLFLILGRQIRLLKSKEMEL